MGSSPGSGVAVTSGVAVGAGPGVLGALGPPGGSSALRPREITPMITATTTATTRPPMMSTCLVTFLAGTS